jgi:hypothetical protein
MGDGKSNMKHGDRTLRIVTAVPDPQRRPGHLPRPAGFSRVGLRISGNWPFAPPTLLNTSH